MTLLTAACHTITVAVLFAAVSSNLTSSVDAAAEMAELKRVDATRKVMENDTVLLPCDNHFTFQYVRWFKENQSLVDSRDSNETPTPERIRLWSNGSLQISQLQPSDTGDYSCALKTDNDTEVTKTHSITVQFPPTVQTEPEGNIELPIGAVFQVMCEARGVPQPKLYWRWNGKLVDNQLIGNRLSIQIEVGSREQSGPIECVANNSIGDIAVAGMFLKVQFPPEVRVVQHVVYTKVGSRSDLECLIEAVPRASVNWYHHGVPMTYDSRISRYETEMQPNGSNLQFNTVIKHTLSIKNVRDSDLGLYECRAENKLGFKSAAIDFTGRPMPCVFKINPGVQSSTSHILVWQTESLSPLMEFKLKFRQIPSASITPQTLDIDFKTDWTVLTIPSELSAGPIHITTYTLHGLQPASVYEVVVYARNHFGWSESSKIVRFATGGEVELPNYSTEAELYSNEDLSSVESEEDRTKEDSVILNEVYDRNTVTSASSNRWCFLNLASLVVLTTLKQTLI
ncbi:opioid-binding protein/cell adhesion molecule homolog [Rhagoletis pomonella]|uniref:opioid-binding protein/cell adhesion molecule homolog n=1 Tax=Rhagoletis pomonella TaxID=28610 RepID=UPI0017852EED|nr:opioid-binding protein/cell adhesion molecule homolog [Rhagoletis pomonella]